MPYSVEDAYQSSTSGDLPKPSAARTPEERQAAMDAFIASVRNTDDATQAEIEEGIDQMLERVYSTRIPQKALTGEDEALSGA
jgi:hypothetical protein